MDRIAHPPVSGDAIGAKVIMDESIIYKETLPDSEEYLALYNTTGWNEKHRFNKEDLREAISNSWYALFVYDSKKLIGSGRIIADGRYHALIVDMIIHPEYQGKGIGGSLLTRLIQKCLEHDIRDIQLFSAKEKYGFYEKYNFERRPENAPGMQYKLLQ